MPTLDELKKSKNIAELLDDNELSSIGSTVYRGYQIDEDSRGGWLTIIKEAMDIANQIIEEKDFPWPGAANIKYPLISIASINFASRVMPQIIQGDRLVKCKVIGEDPKQLKYLRSERVSDYMSWQLLQSIDWVAGADKLLQVLPVLGTVFKKTYWHEQEKRVCSELCVPDRIVVNYNVQSLEAARRITHVMQFCRNDIIERIRRGTYCEVDVDCLQVPEGESAEDTDPSLDVLEQHCWLDLDDDGYKEPYVVTIHKQSKQVLRIINRFKKIEKNKSGEVVRITPDQYFTDYHFIPSPDGGFYSQGFGSLLLPINKSINTVINQLLDSGTLSNTQGGFFSSRLRTKSGEMAMKMGVFQKMDAPTGEKISDSFYQYPFKEPSQTLFALLSLLVQVGNDLASITDIMKGQQQAQNVASNTVSQLVDQGAMLYKAINQRVWRSLGKEYEKIYSNNYYYLKQSDYSNTLDDPQADVKKDFELDTMDIMPIADPFISSDQQKMQRATVIAQMPTIDKREADLQILQSMHVDNAAIARLCPPPNPNAPPPPEQQKLMAEIQLLQAQVAKLSADATLSSQKIQIEQAKTGQSAQMTEAQIYEISARVWKMQQDAAHNNVKDDITNTKMHSQEQLKGLQTANKLQESQHKQTLSEVELAHKVSKENVELGLQNKKIDVDAQAKKEIIETRRVGDDSGDDD